MEPPPPSSYFLLAVREFAHLDPTISHWQISTSVSPIYLVFPILWLICVESRGPMFDKLMTSVRVQYDFGLVTAP